MTDSGMWKLVHAQDADGEIGKIPPLPPGCVWIDWTERSLIEDWPVFMAAGKGKRK